MPSSAGALDLLDATFEVSRKRPFGPDFRCAFIKCSVLRADDAGGARCSGRSHGPSAHLFQGLPYPSGNYTYGPADRAAAP